MNNSNSYRFACDCTKCSEGVAGKYQWVTRWTLNRHKTVEEEKKRGIARILCIKSDAFANTNLSIALSNEFEDIDANNDTIGQAEDDFEDDNQDYSNWEVTELEELVRVDNDCTEAVGFDLPQGKKKKKKKSNTYLHSHFS